MAACRIGQQELSQRCGISVSTLRAIQHGARSRRVQNKTLAAISQALDWPEDHLTRVLIPTGEPPRPTEDPGQLNVIVACIDQRLREISQCLACIEQTIRHNQAPGERDTDH
jgi:transcriptional regulator with XRE-family HTH domain